MTGIFLAEAMPEVPYAVTGHWMLGLIGFLSIAYFAMGGILYGKKLFGRQHTLEAELDRLEKKFREEITESHLRCFRNTEEVKVSVGELRAERREDMEKLNQTVVAIGNDTCALKATNTLQNQRLSSIETDIKVVLQRLPRS